jgi:hypothetical protein
MQTEFKIQDPKTFDQPNYDLINKTVEQFFLQNKEQFLKLYYNLSNTDKFYTLSAAVNNFKDPHMAKAILLGELSKDLENLRFLNKPGITTKFGYEYTGYNSANANIWENIDKVKIPNEYK